MIFFAESKTDISNIVHKSDRDLVREFVNKDYLISTFVHSLISEIFDRADKEMYKNKRNIKKEKNQLG